MPVPLDLFLRTHGFTANPFATTNAEQERESLAAYFVRVPWFDRLVGDPTRPESLILFAPRGYGKTMHRLEVARIASERRNAPALVINFTDFSLLLNEQAPPATQTYLALIRQATLEAFDDFLRRYPERIRQLQASEVSAQRFAALLQLYAPLRALERDSDPTNDPDRVARLMQAFQATRMGLKDWLKELTRIIGAAGCASVYFLIDGIDETGVTQNNPEAAAALLSPLLNAPGVLQECGFAFKFFLPDYLEPILRQQHIGRLDRLPAYRLAWSQEELTAMLARRLTSYSLIHETSQNGYVNRFADLCATEEDIDAILVAAANLSPRRLIDLARAIVEQHCQQANDVQCLISAQTVAQALQGYQQHQAPPTPTLIAATPPPEAPESTSVPFAAESTSQAGQVPPLFFDDHGDVWIGGERRNDQPLPKRLRLCMAYLWQNRSRTVRYEELLEALYGDTLAQRGDPKNSCDKIVRRLRNILEPGQHASPNYIRVQPGTGYELRNVRDTGS